jgi:signal transduction histidine kinase
VVSVEDDGPGIPEGFRSRIFDRFVRVDDGRSSTNPGVGLGLSIAKWATEIHGGMIEMETVEGQGSVFRIILPPSAAL